METDAVLGAGWVDAHDRVHLCFGHATLEANGDALGDFSGIRRTHVEANNTVIVSLVHKDLSICSTLTIGDLLVIHPFKWCESRVISCNVGLSMLGLRISLC